MIEVGLVFVRSTGAPRTEPFFNQLIGGLEEALDEAGAGLLVRMVATQDEEIEHYRRWQADNALHAVVVKDLTDDDRRPAALTELGMPFVVLGDVTQLDAHESIIYVDNAAAMRDALSLLIESGHRHIARVAGPQRFIHTAVRTEASSILAAESGVQVDVVCGDYTEADGERLTARLLASQDVPTAIVYDNDLMACGGLTAATQAGLSVPTDLSLLTFDDSARCHLAVPPLTAVSYDLHELGVQLGQAALAAGRHGKPIRHTGPHPVIVPRLTTVGPPGRHATSSSDSGLQTV